MKKRLPFLSWIRSYNGSTLSMDFVAGFTVGLMMIPQSLAYGVIAGLPPNVSNKVRSGQVRSGWVKLGQVRSDQVRLGQARSGEGRSGQFRLG